MGKQLWVFCFFGKFMFAFWICARCDYALTRAFVLSYILEHLKAEIREDK